MGVVATPYTYTDGNTLSPSGHNSNIFSATGTQGLMSEPNGGLDNTNLVGGFQIQREHVWPGEAVRTTMEEQLPSVDYMNDGFSEANGADGAFATIAGMSCRIFLPYQAAVVLWQWSLFIHHFRFRDGTSAFDVSPQIRVRAGLDGTAVQHTQRLLAATAFDDNRGAGFDAVESRESRNARHWDQAHLSQNLAAGWHEMTVRLLMDTTALDEPIDVTIGTQTVKPTCHLFHRATIGVRNVRALVLL